MNSAVYSEPYKLPAGLMALAVHGAFFALLYFGFTWQALPPQTMSVELWSQLPNDVPDVAVQPPPIAVEENPAQPVVSDPIKPDIALPDKKKIEVKPVIEPAPIKQKITTATPPKSLIDPAAAQAQRELAAQEAAVGRMVDEYVSKIQSKIRRNIIMPPDVANDARTEFAVTLLPGGTVLNARLNKSSGNSAYDNAVERAILKSQPLPLPPDAALFNRFRELKLGFRPIE